MVMKKEKNSHQTEKMEVLGSKKNTLIEQRHLMEAHTNRKTADASNSMSNLKQDGSIDTISNNNKGPNSSQNISSVANQSGKKIEGNIKMTLKGSSNPHNIKPSVSITPVKSSRSDGQLGSGNGVLSNQGNLKKGSPSAGGIEIIPLGHHYSGQSADKGVTKSSKNPKDLPRRSLSENDSMSSSSSNSKKKVSKSGGGGSSSHGVLNSSSKKIRHITDLEKKSSKSGDKKHSSGGSSSLKRSSHTLSPSNHGGKSSKLSSTLSIAKVNSASTSPQLPSSGGGGIEIIPAIGGASQHSTSPSAKLHSTSYSSLHNKDKLTGIASKTSSSGLKVTIKNSSSPSEGKHRSEHRGVGSSGSNSGSTKPKISGSPSSGHLGGSSYAQKQRSSPSSSMAPSQSQQKHSSTLGVNSKHGSSHSQGATSEKDRQRERERQQRSKAERLEKEKISNERKAEEVRKILGGGKALNTTFQIPKLSSSGSAIKSDDYVMMTSTAKAAGELVVSQGSKSANASPKYHGVSPKYGGGVQQIFNSSPGIAGSKGINTSPKLSSGSSPKLTSVSPKGGPAGNFTLPNTSASPRYIGGGSVTPPNVSPKHSVTTSLNFGGTSNLGGSYAVGNSINPNPKSSPNNTSQQSITSSDPSNLNKRPTVNTLGSKTSIVSPHGQNTIGNYKSSSAFPVGNSGKSDGSPLYPTSKYQLSATSQQHGNADSSAESSNAINQVGQINQANSQPNENKKLMSQLTDMPSTVLGSVASKGVTDTIKQSIMVNNPTSSNGANAADNVPEKE